MPQEELPMLKCPILLYTTKLRPRISVPVEAEISVWFLPEISAKTRWNFCENQTEFLRKPDGIFAKTRQNFCENQTEFLRKLDRIKGLKIYCNTNSSFTT